MLKYLNALVQVLVYMVVRVQLGFRLTYAEKNQLLEGILKLGQKFIEEYRDDGAAQAIRNCARPAGITELGSSRVDILTHNHVRLPALPET
jgi:hypothetical protein